MGDWKGKGMAVTIQTFEPKRKEGGKEKKKEKKEDITTIILRGRSDIGSLYNRLGSYPERVLQEPSHRG